jgi:hypothetical protein
MARLTQPLKVRLAIIAAFSLINNVVAYFANYIEILLLMLFT